MSSKIKIRDIKCTALPNKNEFSIKDLLRNKEDHVFDKIVDPYVQFKFLDQTLRTTTIKDQQNPTFKTTDAFGFELSGRLLTSNDYIDINVYDEETFTPDILVGKTQLHLTNFAKHAISIKDYDEPLFDSYGRPTQSRISFQIEYVRLEKFISAMAQHPSGESVTIQSQQKRDHGYSNKESQFKVYVKILEACHLVGSHINPRVRVRIGNKTVQSRTQYCTCKPTYNEMFWFHFKLKPDDLFSKKITFEVFDIKRKEKSATGSSTRIGAFCSKLDFLLSSSNQGIFRKWLLLRNTDSEADLATIEEGKEQPDLTAAGYLKVTATVLGPGEDISRKVYENGSPDKDDVQSNLIPTSSSCLEPVTLIVRIYHAEDLPQMDLADFSSLLSRSKSHKIDAYAKVSFDGESSSTKVVKSYSPKFNQEMYFLHDFPSVCDRLKIQIFDQDPVVDECVGTCVLALTNISKPSTDGYLPTFGPAYVNFYGSVREFSINSNKHKGMNEGDVEGMAYRGRLLIEVITKVGNKIETPIQEFFPEEHSNIHIYKKRTKYKLSVSFITAAMLKSYDYPIEFEVSIGNYGYKLDENIEPQSSVTTPANSVSDGCQHHYIPWNETKPCCVVESDWEDIDFRLQQVNYLTNVIAQLESDTKSIKASTEEIKKSLFQALEKFQSFCKQFEEFDVTQYTQTRLDLKLLEYRKSQLKQICNEMNDMKKSVFAQLLEKQIDEKTVKNVLLEISSLVQQTRKRFDVLCLEHQNSIPDVIIFMIIGGKKKAYCRISASDVLFSEKPLCSGKFCNKLTNLFMNFPNDGKKKDDGGVACCISVIPWFGKELDWVKYKAMNEKYCLYAELYENKSLKPSKLRRSQFSDIDGKHILERDDFKIPPGWEWKGDWQKVPNDNLLYDVDFGHSKFQQEIFYNERRLPFQKWKGITVCLTNFHGDLIGEGEPVPPDGWKWCEEKNEDDWLLNWDVDMNRDCDHDGWEYSTDRSSSSWSSTSRYHHTWRRKLLKRWREITVEPSEIIKRKREKVVQNGCWEFAGMFGHQFHAEEKAFSTVKRRRWLAQMKPINPGASPLFTFAKDQKPFQLMPRVFHMIQDHKWQICIYIWQASTICSGNMHQPYIVAGFQNFWQKTHSIIPKDVPISNPLWNEALVLNNIQLFGSPEMYLTSPPHIIAELWDKNDVGEVYMIGRCSITPLVVVGKESPTLRLQWHTMMKGKNNRGRLLAAAQLSCIETGAKAVIPPKAQTYPFMLPDFIRPETIDVFVKYLFYGIRNMKSDGKVKSPSVELVIGENLFPGDNLKKTSMNKNIAKKMTLAKDPEYLPPIILNVYDHRRFGQKILVGKHVFDKQDMERLLEANNLRGPLPHPIDEIDENDFTKEKHLALEIHDESDGKMKREIVEQLDWWSRYFASKGMISKCGDYLQQHKVIKIFDDELEKEESFQKSNIFKKYPLRTDEEKRDDNTVGELKGILNLHLSNGQGSLKIPEVKFRSVECNVYVYIISGINLPPKDLNGKIDSYVKVLCGKHAESRKEKRVCNNLNPMYGEVFKLKTTLPEGKDLTITVKDFDRFKGNELVGETTIDLEDRYLSRASACVGLPKMFFSSGMFQWRHLQTTPSRILREHVPGGKFLNETEFELPEKKWIEINGQSADDKDTEPEIERIVKLSRYETNNYELAPGESSRKKERLALHILNDPKMKICIIQEHIETRTLWNQLYPEEPQGKIEMFVEIFPSICGTPPPPLKIAPRQPLNYVLRLIVWRTENIELDEKEILSGERMSDIYVKGWLKKEKKKQRTDVHYRSMDGEGLFNWRMVFPIKYIPQQREMVINHKDHFWELDERAECVPPILRLEVWDKDTFSLDDFLGVVELDLCNLEHPANKPIPKKDRKKKEDDQKKQYEKKDKNLFKAKHKRGWWKVTDKSLKKYQGTIELELEIVSESVAESRPAGKGRDEPNMNPKLDPPDRPKTSFFWFTNPWKSFKFVIWKNNKKKVLLLLFISLCTFFILAWIYNMPNYLVKGFT